MGFVLIAFVWNYLLLFNAERQTDFLGKGSLQIKNALPVLLALSTPSYKSKVDNQLS